MGPVGPLQPVGPVLPDGPVGPVLPGGPVLPVGPVNPLGPVVGAIPNVECVCDIVVLLKYIVNVVPSAKKLAYISIFNLFVESGKTVNGTLRVYTYWFI